MITNGVGPSVELSAVDFVDSKFIDEITYLKSYEMGYAEPHFAMPAVVHRVVWTPDGFGNPFHNSIVILEHCKCCGSVISIAAIFDFNVDRCFDFYLPYGEYVNARQLNEGLKAYQETRDGQSRH